MYTTNESEDGPQLRSNMFSLSGTGFFGAVGRSINLGNDEHFIVCLHGYYFYELEFI